MYNYFNISNMSSTNGSSYGAERDGMDRVGMTIPFHCQRDAESIKEIRKCFGKKKKKRQERTQNCSTLDL
jgi:hypothetical protein